MNGDCPLLEVKEVTKVFRIRTSIFAPGRQVVALNRVSFSLKAAEIIGLVGESGSGKTTCGRLIVGLEDPNEGSILLEGRDVAGLKGRESRALKRKVQMVFQDPYQSLNPQLTILDSVAEPLVIHKAGNARSRQEVVLESLDLAGLSPPGEYAFRFPHQLSGGQRQRVAIARAMILRPMIIVADEPTSMLDASYSAKIFGVLRDVRQRQEASILFITHSLASARYLCDRVAVIYHGNLLEIGPAKEVIQNPCHPYTQALIDATPKFGDCSGVRSFGALLAEEREVDSAQGCPFFHRCARAEAEICAGEYPGWRRMGEGHLAACHFAVGDARPTAPRGNTCRTGGE